VLRPETPESLRSPRGYNIQGRAVQSRGERIFLFALPVGLAQVSEVFALGLGPGVGSQFETVFAEPLLPGGACLDAISFPNDDSDANNVEDNIKRRRHGAP
jgi:hypothetical protein